MDFLYGECRSLNDAVDFIHFKRFDDWRVLCNPFATPDQQWIFVLYKFITENAT